MTFDQIEQHDSQHDEQQTQPTLHEEFLPRLRAYFSTLPDIRLAYYQPGPADEQLTLSGPDRARVIVAFSRAVSKEHISKRLNKIRRQFSVSVLDDVEFLDIEQVDFREACEIAFNARPVYGLPEIIERDRLYRYNVFLEWNSSKKMVGAKQDMPPILTPSLERPPGSVSVQTFVTPLYRHLKLIEGHLRELTRMAKMELNEFTADDTQKSVAESCMLKGIQSAILITMSVMHRNVRLSARDYRDLFLLMPVYGMTTRERAKRLAKCADIRDRLMFQYEEVTTVEVYEYAYEVIESLQDFKVFMLEWLFEHYYGPSGEVIQNE